MKLIPDGLHVKDDLKKALTVAKFIEWAIGSTVIIVVATMSTWLFLTTHFQTSAAAAADKAQIQSEIVGVQKQLNLVLIEHRLRSIQFQQEDKIAEIAKYASFTRRLTQEEEIRKAQLSVSLRRLDREELQLLKDKADISGLIVPIPNP